MHSSFDLEKPSWFVLNHIGGAFQDMARKTISRFNDINGTDLELFAPTYVVRDDKRSELKFRTIHLTFHYVFVKGTLAEIKRLCMQNNGFSFLINHSSDKRYAIIDDRNMAQFKTITRAYKNCLPYFPLNEIDLQAGDLVEVIKGDFPGLVGYFMPNPKSKSGNIVLQVYNKVGTIAFNIKATDVRVLEFSSQSKRANDQIDAFVPHLLTSLRYFSKDEELPKALAAKLSIFCGRMEFARLNNRKLDARLQILLYAASLITGNAETANKALRRFEKVSDSVTNVWTRGLISLILAVIGKDMTALSREYSLLRSTEASSRAQKMLLKEYESYIVTERTGTAY